MAPSREGNTVAAFEGSASVPGEDVIQVGVGSVGRLTYSAGEKGSDMLNLGKFVSVHTNFILPPKH